jgi:hypothetical protein
MPTSSTGVVALGCAVAVAVFLVSWLMWFLLNAGAASNPGSVGSLIIVLGTFIPVIPALLAWAAYALVESSTATAAAARSRAAAEAQAQQAQAQAQERALRTQRLLSEGSILSLPDSTVVVCGNRHRHELGHFRTYTDERGCPGCKTTLWDFEDSHLRGLNQCPRCRYWFRSAVCPLCGT